MSTDGGSPARPQEALEGALDEALAGLPGENAGGRTGAAADYRWLGIGIRLGLERPDRAQRLLAMIEAREADGTAPPHAAAAADDTGEGARGTVGPEGPASVPIPSSLLARAAALPPPERASAGPEVMFGWAARLAPGEILSLGRVVHEMLASGSPPDIGRAFGLAWDAGVRLPHQELDAMFREFTELEVTAAGVLAGRDLRAVRPAPRPRGLGALLGWWLPQTRPEESRATAALEASGEPGRLGLVALWNVWVAMRYRSLIPRQTFELLVHPWERVVGPLPEP